ncbi:hypothetical protein [Streptomyces sp. NPDC017941]|uniref:hypothetical protein n=1 Tax=Streptomyces sp. NPDC017941 TaxID=3365018 RepID=UPI003795F0C6
MTNSRPPTADGHIAEWLAQAHPVPSRAHSEWASHGVALLPLGARFDAIRVPARRVHAAVGTGEDAMVTESLTAWLGGPVVRDVRTGSGLYYVLVAVHASWKGAEERLGRGVYLAVPRVGEQVSPVTYWSVRPQRRGRLCDPAHLAALLSTAGPPEALAAVDEIKVEDGARTGPVRSADELYRIHTTHLYTCPLCRTEGDCVEGTRMRRAVRAARCDVGQGGAPDGAPLAPGVQVEG